MVWRENSNIRQIGVLEAKAKSLVLQFGMGVT